uniref:Gypsy retrotransposon integrase-like protein 1 n=1 Tax=Anguilla anguilla TaxID=7936 RepID=A0A0E9T7X6_ANGAN
MFWSHMNRDIEILVQRCETCQRHKYQQPKEPHMAHSKPVGLWRKVRTDLFQLAGRDYLVIMDYQSNYPEFALLSDTTGKQ